VVLQGMMQNSTVRTGGSHASTTHVCDCPDVEQWGQGRKECKQEEALGAALVGQRLGHLLADSSSADDRRVPEVGSTQQGCPGYGCDTHHVLA
jgi:hypothetical protein